MFTNSLALFLSLALLAGSWQPNTILSLFGVQPRDNRGLATNTQTKSNEQRVALVIGNAAYMQSPLLNPVNDARDMTATLRSVGFEVLSGENRNQTQMKQLIREFGQKIRNGGIGLFYFAGHGVQVNGRNYLIPVGAVINSEAEVEYESVEAGFVLAQMEEARNRLNIVILDACRNNPFARDFRADSRGLAAMRNAPIGTLIAYATAANEVSSDGAGRNGLFTQELLANLKTPGLTLEQVFRRTRTNVRSKSGGKQVPYEYTSVEGEDFYFAPSTNGSMLPVTAPAAEVSTTPPVAKPTAKMSVASVPLTAMSFITAEVDATGNITNQRQEQGWGFEEDLGNGVKLQMVEIPGGTFQMGSPNTEDHHNKAEEPQHQVRVRGFAMGKYEVTQAQWQVIMGKSFKGDMNLPVKDVSWEEAQAFCRKLSAQTGRSYRLPTEAEWEYAARAGTTTAFAFGDKVSKQVINYGNNNGFFNNNRLAVGKLGVANGFGLYDMHGNMMEWCEDVWHKSYIGAPSDGSAWLSGGDSKNRVLRGGSFDILWWYCRSASRFSFAPGARYGTYFGFRLVASARTQ